VVTVDVQADVPRDLEVVLLRCAQEGLANVRKHAAARTVALRVAEEGGRAVLTVTDDGTGPGDGSGFGIPGMRDRLAVVAGDLALDAGAGGGSVLTVRVPVPEVAA
jgi:signal transduction histidine kinase